MTIPSKAFTLPFLRKEWIAKDVYSFYFDRSKLSEYDFFPGQYNRIMLPIVPTDDRGSSHFFTVSSSPLQKEFLMITTKISQKHSDFKEAFFNLEKATNVEFFGPMGGFFLREEDTTPRVFLAGGIGITPFHSMITYSAEKKLQISMTLIVSFSTIEDVVFYKELNKAAEDNSYIKVIYTISHPEQLRHPGKAAKAAASRISYRSNQRDSRQSQNDEFKTGRISEVLIRKYVSDIQTPIFMVVGPPPMVDATVELLQNMKIPQEHIKVEHFTGY